MRDFVAELWNGYCSLSAVDRVAVLPWVCFMIIVLQVSIALVFVPLAVMLGPDKKAECQEYVMEQQGLTISPDDIARVTDMCADSDKRNVILAHKRTQEKGELR